MLVFVVGFVSGPANCLCVTCFTRFALVLCRGVPHNTRELAQGARAVRGPEMARVPESVAVSVESVAGGVVVEWEDRQPGRDPERRSLLFYRETGAAAAAAIRAGAAVTLLPGARVMLTWRGLEHVPVILPPGGEFDQAARSAANSVWFAFYNDANTPNNGTPAAYAHLGRLAAFLDSVGAR